MSNAKHTPGPWSVGATRSRFSSGFGGTFSEVLINVGEPDNHGNALAIVHMGGPGAISTERGAVEANARLIAAAPELLEALRDVIGWVAVEGNWHTDAPRKAVERAREAIAKTTEEDK